VLVLAALVVPGLAPLLQQLRGALEALLPTA
jgi:hypothetical protein